MKRAPIEIGERGRGSNPSRGGSSIRRLIASEFMTLDGVMEAPGHEEHPDGKNAWALQHAADDLQRYKIEELFAVDALLLGRVTHQI